jgi:hypothetical protein
MKGHLKVKSMRYLVVAFGITLIIVTAVLAEDKVAFESTADFFSKYVWRGQNLVDDWVFQPGVSTSYAGFTAGIWGSLDLTDENGFEGDFTEVDYSLDYSGEIPGVELLRFFVGAIYYDFPTTGIDSTTELYWGFSADMLLSPSLTVYHDVDEADGTYISASIGHSIENIAGLDSGFPISLELGASIGWGNGHYNEFYWGTTGSELNDLVLSASLPVEVAGWIITPGVDYVRLISSDIRDTNAYGADDDLFYTGVSFAREF